MRGSLRDRHVCECTCIPTSSCRNCRSSRHRAYGVHLSSTPGAVWSSMEPFVFKGEKCYICVRFLAFQRHTGCQETWEFLPGSDLAMANGRLRCWSGRHGPAHQVGSIADPATPLVSRSSSLTPMGVEPWVFPTSVMARVAELRITHRGVMSDPSSPQDYRCPRFRQPQGI